MEHDSIKKIYNGYAHLYDFLFKRFFHPRQKVAIKNLSIPEGARILDVGVGTGLTLPLYPRSCQVIGVDISIDMLNEARKKVKKFNLTNVELLEMDACNMAFEDNSFDYVIATHIINVVPDPFKVVNEMRRVARSGGELVIVNHFVSSNPVIARVEKKCDPFFRKCGWRTDMSLDDLVTATNLEVYKTDKVNRLDLWKIVHVNNNKAPAKAGN